MLKQTPRPPSAKHGPAAAGPSVAGPSVAGPSVAGPCQAKLDALNAAVNRPPPVQRQPTRKSPPNGLPDGLKSGIEALSGLSMDQVRVHYNSSRPAEVGALAYTQGSHIHVAPHQERHLPHEAWHAVQQAQGRVRATSQLKAAVPLNDDKGLEREADVMGARAVQMTNTPTGAVQRRAVPAPVSPILQRAIGMEAQAQLGKDAQYILKYTENAEVDALKNRVTFSADEAKWLGDITHFAAYRDEAAEVQRDFGHVFDAIRLTHASAYDGNEMDGPSTTLRSHRQAIREVRLANDDDNVHQAKFAMKRAVAKPAAFGALDGYDTGAFGKAETRTAAAHALAQWEVRYFTIDGSSLIAAAKTGAHNGHHNATVWKGISPRINNKDTHLTTYNGDFPHPFPSLYVTAATDRAASDQAANNALPDGAGHMGVHLTAERFGENDPGNPRLFGNPPDTARAVNMGGGFIAGNFAAPMNQALDHVRSKVWETVQQKTRLRP